MDSTTSTKAQQLTKRVCHGVTPTFTDCPECFLPRSSSLLATLSGVCGREPFTLLAAEGAKQNREGREGREENLVRGVSAILESGVIVVRMNDWDEKTTMSENTGSKMESKIDSKIDRRTFLGSTVAAG